MTAMAIGVHPSKWFLTAGFAEFAEKKKEEFRFFLAELSLLCALRLSQHWPAVSNRT
jgi:hypothetical protein